MATISSHILDSVIGDHAAGIVVDCFRLCPVAESQPAQPNRELVFSAIGDSSGRITETVVTEPDKSGTIYELVFHSANYFNKATATPTPPTDGGQIMPCVVVRILLPDAGAKYHLPLVLSPHSYTVWWSGLHPA